MCLHATETVEKRVQVRRRRIALVSPLFVRLCAISVRVGTLSLFMLSCVKTYLNSGQISILGKTSVQPGNSTCVPFA